MNSSLWLLGLNSLTRDQTRAPCVGSQVSTTGPPGKSLALIFKSQPRYQLASQVVLVTKKPTCQCRRHKRHRFDPWVGKIPWRRAWPPTPVLLGESHGQMSPVGYRPQGHKELDTTEVTAQASTTPPGSTH